MKVRNTGRAFVAAMAIAAAVTLTACGSDDGGSDTTTTAASTSASTTTGAQNADLPPTPTPAELNERLAKALDPATPAADIAAQIQGGEQAVDLISQLAEAVRSSGAQIEVTSVAPPEAGVLTATATLTLAGAEPNPNVQVRFVPEDGIWKIEKAWACGVMSVLDPNTPPPAICA